jgi:hypothetical protein
VFSASGDPLIYELYALAHVESGTAIYKVCDFTFVNIYTSEKKKKKLMQEEREIERERGVDKACLVSNGSNFCDILSVYISFDRLDD